MVVVCRGPAILPGLILDLLRHTTALVADLDNDVDVALLQLYHNFGHCWRRSKADLPIPRLVPLRGGTDSVLQKLLAHELHMPRDVVQGAGHVPAELDLWCHAVDGLGKAGDLVAQLLDDPMRRHVPLNDAYKAVLRSAHSDVVLHQDTDRYPCDKQTVQETVQAEVGICHPHLPIAFSDEPGHGLMFLKLCLNKPRKLRLIFLCQDAGKV
mmetsp:Transcript_25248/g.59296  ORF Transcript_25248/g.59296 Transcript_25248/m.59296 type:complete len:211 (-) Transcript_25248:324-956(-)